MAPRKRLGQLLTELGVIDEHQLQSALGHQKQWGGKLGSVLVQKGFCNEPDLVKALSQHLAMPVVRLAEVNVDPRAVKLVSRALAEKLQAIPYEVSGSGRAEVVSLAMSDPTDLASVDEIAFHTGKRIRPMLCAASEVTAAIQQHYPTDAPAPQATGRGPTPASAPAPSSRPQPPPIAPPVMQPRALASAEPAMPQAVAAPYIPPPAPPGPVDPLPSALEQIDAESLPAPVEVASEATPEQAAGLPFATPQTEAGNSQIEGCEPLSTGALEEGKEALPTEGIEGYSDGAAGDGPMEGLEPVAAHAQEVASAPPEETASAVPPPPATTEAQEDWSAADAPQGQAEIGATAWDAVLDPVDPSLPSEANWGQVPAADDAGASRLPTAAILGAADRTLQATTLAVEGSWPEGPVGASAFSAWGEGAGSPGEEHPAESPPADPGPLDASAGPPAEVADPDLPVPVPEEPAPSYFAPPEPPLDEDVPLDPPAPVDPTANGASGQEELVAVDHGEAEAPHAWSEVEDPLAAAATPDPAIPDPAADVPLDFEAPPAPEAAPTAPEAAALAEEVDDAPIPIDDAPAATPEGDDSFEGAADVDLGGDLEGYPEGEEPFRPARLREPDAPPAALETAQDFLAEGSLSATDVSTLAEVGIASTDGAAALRLLAGLLRTLDRRQLIDIAELADEIRAGTSPGQAPPAERRIAETES